MWDATALPALTPVARIRTAPLRVPAAAFAPRGATLAVADGLHTIRLWGIALARTSHSSRTHGFVVRLRQTLRVSGRTTALAWSPDSARLAAGTAEGAVVLWRRNDGWRSAMRVLGATVWALAWAPSGSALAAGCADGAVRLLGSAGLHMERMLVAPLHRAPVMQVPDDGPLPQRHPSRGRKQKGKRGTRNGPRLAAGAAINGLAWSPDGDLLAVTATGVPLRLWRPLGGAVLATYHPMWDQNVVAWRPDGTLAAVAMDDGSVTVLRAAEPPFLTAVACRVSIRDWCALLSRPLAPALDGRPGVSPAFMGR